MCSLLLSDYSVILTGGILEIKPGTVKFLINNQKKKKGITKAKVFRDLKFLKLSDFCLTSFHGFSAQWRLRKNSHLFYHELT